MSAAQHTPSTAATRRILGASGMADRVRAFPWNTTPLGAIDTWSDSLVSNVNLVLASPVSTILMAGPDLVTLYNDAYIPTLAERHPQALGMPGNVLWADAWDAVGGQIEQVAATGTSFKHDNVLIPVERNGAVTDTWFTYSFSPVLESRDNSIGGVLCMAQDVTPSYRATVELARTQQELARTANELHQVMDATTDSIVSINRDWQITYMNPRAMRTYHKDSQVLGSNLWRSFPEAVYPGSPYLTHHYATMDEGRPAQFEAYYPAPLDLWVRVALFPTADGIVSFSRNITEEKRTAAVLLQTEKLAAVGRLASSIAHEINNPLEAVTNLLYIARGESDMANVRDLLHTADDELRRVAVIANQTLAFHKQSTRPRAVACTDLVQGALLMFRSKLKNANITVESCRSSGNTVIVYEGELRQVLNNLFSNAVDAMPRGGRLQIRSRDRMDRTTGQHGLVLTVADNGTGIAPDQLERIFDAFYTTKGIGGTGLGLWISREIVGRHNGSLRVRSSQNPSCHGTVFSIFVPFQNPAAEALRAAQNLEGTASVV